MKMQSKCLMMIVLAAMLPACAGNQIHADSSTAVQIDSALLQECDVLSDLKADPEPQDVIAQRGKDVGSYVKCKDNHSSLIRVVKKAFNLK